MFFGLFIMSFYFCCGGRLLSFYDAGALGSSPQHYRAMTLDGNRNTQTFIITLIY